MLKYNSSRHVYELDALTGQSSRTVPEFGSGDTVRVHAKVGAAEALQLERAVRPQRQVPNGARLLLREPDRAVFRLREDRRRDQRQADAEADPGVSAGWRDGRRAGESGG